MALGRGLGALINAGQNVKNTAKSPDTNGEMPVWFIPLGNIFANPKQPRRNFAPEPIEELAASLKEHGVLQPILVSERTDGGYEIIAGERRWRAAKLAGLPTIPALVKKMPEQSRLELALVENIQRENLSPLEEAFAYKRLVEEFNLTQQEVALKVGKSRPAVANTIRLLDLPVAAQTALSDGKINAGQARALLTLKTEKECLEMLSSMLGQKISVRELERTVAQKTNSQFSRRDPNLSFLEDKMRSVLGAKVTITKKGNRGTITIDYHSEEELKNIIGKISGAI